MNIAPEINFPNVTFLQDKKHRAQDPEASLFSVGKMLCMCLVCLRPHLMYCKPRVAGKL